MSSLEEILQHAQCLERGRKSETSAQISLGQLSGFFKRISSDYEKSSEGRDLLAYRKVDLIASENIIAAFQEEKKKKLEKKEGLNDSNQLVIIKLASERHELELNRNIDNMWTKIKGSTASEYRHDKKAKKASADIQITRKDEQKRPDQSAVLLQNNAEKAGELSKQITKNIGGRFANSIDGQKEIPSIALSCIDKSDHITVAYFEALGAICRGHGPKIGDKGFRDVELKFLMKQYRKTLGFENDGDGLLKYMRDKYADHWKRAWFLFRSGFLGNIKSNEEIANYISYAFELRDIREIMEIFYKRWNSVNGNDDDDFGDTLDGWPNNNISKTFIEIMNFDEITSPLDGVIVETAEDYLFVLLLPFWKSVHESDLFEIQRIVLDETNRICKINPDFMMVRPLFLLLTRQYDIAVKSLIETGRFKVETALFAISLYDRLSEQTKSEASVLINELSNFLVDMNAGLAIQCIATSRKMGRAERHRVTKFVLSRYNYTFNSEIFKSPLVDDIYNNCIEYDGPLVLDGTVENINCRKARMRIAQGDSSVLEEIVEIIDLFSLQDLFEICLSIANKTTLAKYIEVVLKSLLKVKATAINSHESVIRISSTRVLTEKPISEIPDYDVPELRAEKLPPIYILLCTLNRASELRAEEREDLSVVAHYIIDELPNKSAIKLTRILDLLIAFDRNDASGIMLCFENHYLPVDKDEVQELLQCSEIGEINLSESTLIKTATYNSIVFLANNHKSEEDLELLSKLFKLVPLINASFDMLVSITSIQKSLEQYIK